MNQKLLVKLEVEKEGNLFCYYMPFGSSYQAAYDAAMEIANNIVELSKLPRPGSEKETKNN